MADKKSSAGSLAKQIDTAKRNIESWPTWLRESARFEGRNHSFDQQSQDTKDHDSAVAGTNGKKANRG